MTEPRKPSLIMPAAVTLTVLVGLYVGAYYGLVERNSYRGGWAPHFAISQGDQYPSVWSQFFAPIHWLDRRLRPHVWEPAP
jgi:hypothetical protein